MSYSALMAHAGFLLSGTSSPGTNPPGTTGATTASTAAEDDNGGSAVGAIVQLGILLLIPVGLFAFNWPVWLLVVLLFIDLILLFFVSMTSVFLLRVFFADRRRGRGRQTGVAKPQTRVISTTEDQTDDPGDR